MRLTQKECRCPVASKDSTGLVDIWCHCPHGWSIKMFGTSNGKP